MKLAEAIKEKGRLKKTVAELREKLEKSAEGKGEEKPAKILEKLEDALRRMEYLTAAICRTNERIQMDGKTMTQLISARDTLFFQIELYRDLIRRLDNADDPSSSGLSAFGLQSRADRMRGEMRSLNDLIQEVNWTRDLME